MTHVRAPPRAVVRSLPCRPPRARASRRRGARAACGAGTRAVVIGGAAAAAAEGAGRGERDGTGRSGAGGSVREFFKDGRSDGRCRDPRVLRVPRTLRCEPLHDRVRHLQGLVPRQVRRREPRRGRAARRGSRRAAPGTGSGSRLPPSPRGGQWLRGGSTGGAVGARPVWLPPRLLRRGDSTGAGGRPRAHGSAAVRGRTGRAKRGGAGYERATDAGLAGSGPPRSCADCLVASLVPPRPRGLSPGTGRSPGGEVRAPGLSPAGCERRVARTFCSGGGGGGERGSPHASRPF